MPDYSERQGGSRPLTLPWASWSVELLNYNILIGKNIAEYWRGAADIPVGLISIAFARETPMDRRRKFKVIAGGKT
jgi:hypothetical protein